VAALGAISVAAIAAGLRRAAAGEDAPECAWTGGEEELPPEMKSVQDLERWALSLNGELKNGGQMLEDIASRKGFDGPPVQVANLQEARGRAIYRGVRTQENANQFAHGKYFGGSGGMYGSGTYAVGGREIAAEYAGTKGSVIAMRLSDDARIISYANLEREMITFRNQFGEQIEAMERRFAERAQAAYARGDRIAAARFGEASSYVNRILTDEGLFAALRGYDAVALRDNMMLLLNRTRVMI